MVNTDEEILHIKELSVHYHITGRGTLKAVEGVDLKICKRETVALVGESGCGKTTLALSIVRLVPEPGRILGGKILFKNKSLLEMTENELRLIRGKEISMIFQDPLTYLNPVMKVKDQVAEPILVHKIGSKMKTEESVIELLNKVRIPSAEKVANYYPHQLSGGMRQRIMLCIAISCNPALLIADEPTTALDVTTQAQILELINELKENLEMSVLLVTHDLGIVSDICDKIYVMYAGKIVEDGDVFRVFEDPRHPYTLGLLNSALSIDEYRKTLVTIPGTVPDLINPLSGCSFYPRCPKRKAICRKQQPSKIEVEPEHTVSCWLYN